MIKNTDSILNVLLQVHIKQTKYGISPFPFETSLDIDKFNKEKYIQISKSNEEFNKFVKVCFDDFVSTNPNILRGSVHLNPHIWTKFALKTIGLGYKNKESKIMFPNGCCSKGINCPINLFYFIVLKNISY